jgi:hypothetical protein
MDGCMDGWMHGCMDRWMDGCMDGWMDGWVRAVCVTFRALCTRRRAPISIGFEARRAPAPVLM